jgi:hypothetical protein
MIIACEQAQGALFVVRPPGHLRQLASRIVYCAGGDKKPASPGGFAYPSSFSRV